MRIPIDLRLARGLLALAVGLPVLAGCGGSSAPATPTSATASAPAAPTSVANADSAVPSTTMPSMTMPAGVATNGSAAGPATATSKVTIQNFAFSPETVTVRAGTTVTWTNTDSDAHTVTSRTGAFHSPVMDTGATYQYTFTKPGTYPYLCSIHPFMLGTVVVTP